MSDTSPTEEEMEKSALVDSPAVFAACVGELLLVIYLHKVKDHVVDIPAALRVHFTVELGHRVSYPCAEGRPRVLFLLVLDDCEKLSVSTLFLFLSLVESQTTSTLQSRVPPNTRSDLLCHLASHFKYFFCISRKIKHFCHIFFLANLFYDQTGAQH